MKVTVNYTVNKSSVIDINDNSVELTCYNGMTEKNLEKWILTDLLKFNRISKLENVKPDDIKNLSINNADLCYMVDRFVPCCVQAKMDSTINYCPMCGKKL